eukprot:1471006-Amphidinium_carterae.1
MSRACRISSGDAKAVSGSDPSMPIVISRSLEMRRRFVWLDTDPTCNADFTLASGKTEMPLFLNSRKQRAKSESQGHTEGSNL